MNGRNELRDRFAEIAMGVAFKEHLLAKSIIEIAGAIVEQLCGPDKRAEYLADPGVRRVATATDEDTARLAWRIADAMIRTRGEGPTS